MYTYIKKRLGRVDFVKIPSISPGFAASAGAGGEEIPGLFPGVQATNKIKFVEQSSPLSCGWTVCQFMRAMSAPVSDCVSQRGLTHRACTAFVKGMSNVPGLTVIAQFFFYSFGETHFLLGRSLFDVCPRGRAGGGAAF